MAHPLMTTPRLEAALERVRPFALAIPGVVEKVSHGSPTWFTKDGRSGRTFASLHDEQQWYEGRLCLWAGAPEGAQQALVSTGPERFFVPPYVGPSGWVGLRLDLPEVDWDEVAGLVEDGYEHITSKPGRR